MAKPMQEPLKIWVIQPMECIKRLGLKEVKTNLIFEPGTKRFHPEGFFSEEIFGPVTSEKRVYTCGYIDLRAEIINPFIYARLIKVKSLYEGIIKGEKFAKFDKKENDFVPATKDDPEAGTGFVFFKKYAPLIKFNKKETSKAKLAKIKVLEKYRDRWFIDKFIVAPAGLRDLREEDGHLKQDDINKAYMALLALAQSLPQNIKNTDNPIFNTILVTMQQKAYEIYLYWKNYADEKRGYFQDKFGVRRVTFGTRNVISSLTLDQESYEDEDYLRIDETFVPLFQCMKMVQPFIINFVMMTSKDNLIDSSCKNAWVFDPKTLNKISIPIKFSDGQMFIHPPKIESLINKFRYLENRFNIVGIKSTEDGKEYPFMYGLKFIYKDKKFFMIIKNKDQLDMIKKVFKIDDKNIESLEPLNYYEYFYIATYSSVLDKYVSVTRHPVIEDGSMYFSKIKITTTDPHDKIYFILSLKFDTPVNDISSQLLETLKKHLNITKSITEKGKSIFGKKEYGNFYIFTINNYIISTIKLSHFPIKGAKIVDHEVPHISKWEGLGADADGDMVESIIPWTYESNQEIKEKLNSMSDLILPNLKFKYSFGTTNVGLFLKWLTS